MKRAWVVAAIAVAGAGMAGAVQVEFAGPSTDGSESATSAELRVEISAPVTGTLTVDYDVTGGTATGGGTDYTLASGTLTFNPGDDLWKFINFTVNDDGSLESDETIVVTLSNPQGGTLGSQTTHTYTILDDDRTGQTWNCSTIGQMEYAWRNCQPNDEIVLAAGTYVLEAIPNITAHHIIMRGATGNPDDVILTGPGMNVDQNPREAMVVKADNFTLMDLTIKEVYHNGIHIKGENDVDRVWINNVKTFNCGERHIKGSHNSADRASNSEDTLIELVVMEADQSPSGHPNNDYVGGMDLMTMKNLIIRDCMAINITGATGGGRGAIFLWQENYNVTVERNRIYGGDSGICLGNPSYPDAPYHWAVDGGIVRNNFVTRGAYMALEFCFTRDIKVYHNSVYSDDCNYFRTVHLYGGNTTNLLSKYNIIRGQIYENGATWTDTGSIIGCTPQADWFTDTSIADLHLTENATDAIDAASPLAEVPEDFDEESRGSSPDVGGDEYQGVVLPTVTLSATDADAAEEGQDPGEFTVSRTQTSGDLVVYYSVSGTAAAADYEETLTGSVTILDGQTSATIDITPVDDSEIEGDETVILTLTPDPAYQIGSPNSGTVTIADNDQTWTDDVTTGETPVAGTVNGSHTDTHASDNTYESITEIESGGKPSKRHSYLEHQWTFNVTGGASVTFYVEAYKTVSSDGDDFTFAYSTNGSDWTDMLTVTKTSDDDAYQTSGLPDTLSGTVYVRVVDTDRGQGNRALDTIYVDHMFIRSSGEAPVTVSFDLASSSGDEGVTPADLAVSLNRTHDQTVTVDYDVTGGTATGGGVDYTLASGQLQFTPGQTTKNIPITIVDDGDEEDDETIEVTLSNPVNAELGAITVHTYTIIDNDGPATLFSDGFESGDFATGGWADSGSASVTGQAAYAGDYGAKLAKVASITKPLSTAGYTGIRVKFYRKTSGLDSGEWLYCEWSDDGGQGWYELGKTQATSWAQDDLACPAGAANNPDFQVRFRTNANKNNESGFVDEVEIVGTAQ